MENVQKFFQENPRYFGIVLVVFGIIIFVSTFFNNIPNTYNHKKLDSWINIFGKKNGRIAEIIISSLLLISGVMYLVLWK
jgi:hypothetical protein